MILTINLTKDVDYGPFQLIEKVAHVYLPVSQLPGHRYYNGHVLAAKLGVSPDELLSLAHDSKSVHAVVLPTGIIFFHPDGIDSWVTKQNKKMLREEMRRQKLLN